MARQSNLDDFCKAEAIQHIEPLLTPDWGNRNWEQEARQSSAAPRLFPDINESRVTYYLVYATEYLLTTVGTEIRTNRTYAAVEAALNTLAHDPMPLRHPHNSHAPNP